MGRSTTATSTQLSLDRGRGPRAGVAPAPARPSPADLADGADAILRKVGALVASGPRVRAISLAEVEEIVDELRAFHDAIERAAAGPIGRDALEHVQPARRRLADAQLLVLGLLAGGPGSSGPRG